MGHVILARDEEGLARSRRHERVHVRQFERWGPLLLPAYVLAGCLVHFRGGHWYLDNPFEQQAFTGADERLPRSADEEW